VSGDGYLGPAARLALGMHEGRRTAIDRMAGECADLGGHGIVGAVLAVTEIPATSLTAAAIKFTVTGTAVRASGCPPLPRPLRPPRITSLRQSSRAARWRGSPAGTRQPHRRA
jgi:hypothetical protein